MQARNLTPGLFGEGYIVSDSQVETEAESKKDANKTSGLEFDGFKNGGLASVKFYDEKLSVCVEGVSNLTSQTKSEINLSSNSVRVKFDSAAKNANLTSRLNLSHKQGGVNLNPEFDAAQILLAANRQTLFAQQGGRVNLTQKAVLAKVQNV